MRLSAKQVAESVGLAGDLSVSGKIVRVYDKKSGTSDKGNWSFQNLTIQDETGEATICLKNRKEEVSKDSVGKSISVSSNKTSNGILGVKIEKEEYKDKDGNDKSSIKVIITPSATLTIDNASVASTPQAQKPHEEPAEPEFPKEELNLDLLRKETIQIAWDAWIEATRFVLDEKDPNFPAIISAIIQASGRNADTLFISKAGRR